MKPSTGSVSGASDITISGSVNCRLIRRLKEIRTSAATSAKGNQALCSSWITSWDPGRATDAESGLAFPARATEFFHCTILVGVE